MDAKHEEKYARLKVMAQDGTTLYEWQKGLRTSPGSVYP